jgi:hypothetical protein
MANWPLQQVHSAPIIEPKLSVKTASWAKLPLQYLYHKISTIKVQFLQAIAPRGMQSLHVVESWTEERHNTALQKTLFNGKLLSKIKAKSRSFLLSFSLSLCSVPNRRCKVAISLFATRLWFVSDVFVGCNFFLWLLDHYSDVLQVVISFFGCLIRILMCKQVVIFFFCARLEFWYIFACYISFCGSLFCFCCWSSSILWIWILLYMQTDEKT